MHCLWGLQQQGFQFELKGGTSLSKGFGIIERFSEDIDIQIHLKAGEDVKFEALGFYWLMFCIIIQTFLQSTRMQLKQMIIIIIKIHRLRFT